MSKDQLDRRRWDSNPPSINGWKRIPMSADQNEWDVLPESFDETPAPFLVEWQPSTMGGYGNAAVWIRADER